MGHTVEDTIERLESKEFNAYRTACMCWVESRESLHRDRKTTPHMLAPVNLRAFRGSLTGCFEASSCCNICNNMVETLLGHDTAFAIYKFKSQ